MDTTNQHNEAAQNVQPAQPGQKENPQTEDTRQQAIEQEEDTARLRSERKSVEDGSGDSAQR